MKKKLALGALAGAAVAYVVKPMQRWRNRGEKDSWTSSATGAPPAAPVAPRTEASRDSTSTAGVAFSTDAPAVQTESAHVDPDELTSPGTVDDPKLEEQRAREAAERERESRLSDETKFDELRGAEQERDVSQVVGDVPEPREE
jgi:CCR4-NOT transcriptional regulation complex NOT5 subunit